VLYLLHGANGGYDGFVDPNQTDAGSLLAGVPAVIVMPDGGTYGMYSNWWDKGALTGPNWADYHLGTVKNLIEHRFRIRPGRRWHAIAGISMGGQGTLRYAAMLPGYFGSAAGLSPALPDMRNPIAYVGMPVLVSANGSGLVTYENIWGPVTGAYAKANNPAELIHNLADTRLYLTSGNGVSCPGDPLTRTYPLDVITEFGIRVVTDDFAAKARKIGVDVTERHTCGVHTFGVWDRAFADILATWGFFGPVPDNPTSWTYTTGMRHGTMWQFGFTFTGQPGFDRFTRTGSTLSGAGTGTVTLSTRGCTFTATLPFSRTLPSTCHPTMPE
jgi:S-formylglutathione hydrolase FrmB